MLITKPTTKNIKDLELDTENPRLNIINKKTNVVDDLIRIVTSTKMINLMKDIVSTQTLNALNNFGIIDGKIAIDGNRRLLALKLLIGDIKVKHQDINDFLKTVDRKEILKWDGELSVVEYKSRADANDSIRKNHITSEDGVNTLEWETFSKRIENNDPLSKFLLENMKLYDFDPLSILLSLDNKEGIKYTGIHKLFNSSLTKMMLGYSVGVHGSNILDKNKFKELFISLLNYAKQHKLSSQDVFKKEKTNSWLNNFVASLENEEMKKYAKKTKKIKTTLKGGVLKEQKKTKTKKVGFKVIIPQNNEYFTDLVNFAKEVNRIINKSYPLHKKVLSLTLRPAFEELIKICETSKLFTVAEVKKEYKDVAAVGESEFSDNFKFHKMITIINSNPDRKVEKREWGNIKTLLGYKLGNKNSGTYYHTLSSYMHNLDSTMPVNDWKKLWNVVKVLAQEIEILISKK